MINTLIIESTTKQSVSSKTYKIKPWATTDIILLIRRRDHLHIQVQKHPDNTRLKQFYTKFRNKLTNLSEKLKHPIIKKKFLKQEIIINGVGN